MTIDLKSFFKPFPSPLYFVACSGGLDSMFLLDSMRNLQLPISVLHVNYGLRAEESVKDNEFIRAYCKTHQLPFHCLKVNLNAHLQLNGGNLQNEARKFRYEFFKEHLDKNEDSFLVTAHHQDDQLETFWLQLFRGSGLAGLSGMKENNQRILRPLLRYKRAEIATQAQKMGLSWREDQSNADPKYSRNFLRLEALPFLRESFPDLDEKVLLLQKVMMRTQRECAKKGHEMSVRWQKTKRITWTDLNAPDVVFHEALKACNIPSALMPAIQKLKQQETGKRILIEDSNSKIKAVWRERNALSLVYGDESTPFQIHFESVTYLPETFNLWEWYVPTENLPTSPTLRQWNPGETIPIIGLKGKKKVSDLLKDAHIPLVLRKTYPIVVLNDLIIGIPGIALNRNMVAQPKHKNITKITFVKP